MNDDQIKSVARFLAKRHDREEDPDRLEPGDVPCIDGTMPNGDPGHFRWRDFAYLAGEIINILKKDEQNLLNEIAKMNPITDDKNEEVIWWCVFCGNESTTPSVEHRSDCLWIRTNKLTA